MLLSFGIFLCVCVCTPDLCISHFLLLISNRYLGAELVTPRDCLVSFDRYINISFLTPHMVSNRNPHPRDPDSP